MSGMLPKSRVPTVRHVNLPLDVKQAIAHFKNAMRRGHNIGEFGNRKDSGGGRPVPRDPTGRPLPKLPKGSCYYEFCVGRARAGDPNPAGQRRLVVEVCEKPCTIREIYFSDDHYYKGSFCRVV